MTSQCLLILPILHKILFLAGIFAVRVIFDQAAACTHTKQLCVLHPHRSVMHPLLLEQEMMFLQAVGMESLVIRSGTSLPLSPSVVHPIYNNIITIIYPGSPLARSDFQWGPAK